MGSMGFMRPVSSEEMAQLDARVRALYASPNIEDQIVAILMDIRIGAASDTERTARAKARGIIAHLLGVK